MHADEDRIGVEEIEFHIPTLSPDHMNEDRPVIVMGRGAVILTPAPLDQIADIPGRDLPGQEQVFRGDPGSAHFMLVCPVAEGGDDLLLGGLEPVLRNIR
jgi:hypothetical protein